MRRHFLVLAAALLLLTAPPSLHAQQRYPVFVPRPETEQREQRQQRGISPVNPWIGFQTGYNLAGNGVFADNLYGAGGGRLDVLELGPVAGSSEFRAAVYVTGNIAPLGAADGKDALLQSAQDLLNSSKGLQFGIYPTVVWGDPGQMDAEAAVFWAGLAYRANGLRSEADSTLLLQQARISVGAEYQTRGFEDSRRPLTVSVEPFLALFDGDRFAEVFGRERSSFVAVEVATIVPAGEHLGVQAAGVYAKGFRPAYRLGILVQAFDEDG